MNKTKIEEKIAKLEADFMNEIAKLQEQIASTEKWKHWVPEKGDAYWWVAAVGDTRFDCWSYSDRDRACLATGNVFRTKEEAQDRVNHMKALTRLASFTKGFEPDWEDTHQYKYYPFYSHHFKQWNIANTHCDERSVVAYFANELDVSEAIDAMGDQMDELLEGGW